MVSKFIGTIPDATERKGDDETVFIPRIPFIPTDLSIPWIMVDSPQTSFLLAPKVESKNILKTVELLQ